MFVEGLQSSLDERGDQAEGPVQMCEFEASEAALETGVGRVGGLLYVSCLWMDWPSYVARPPWESLAGSIALLEAISNGLREPSAPAELSGPVRAAVQEDLSCFFVFHLSEAHFGAIGRLRAVWLDELIQRGKELTRGTSFQCMGLATRGLRGSARAGWR